MAQEQNQISDVISGIAQRVNSPQSLEELKQLYADVQIELKKIQNGYVQAMQYAVSLEEKVRLQAETIEQITIQRDNLQAEKEALVASGVIKSPPTAEAAGAAESGQTSEQEEVPVD